MIISHYLIQRSVCRVCSEVRSPPGVCFTTVCFFFVALVTVLSNKIYVTKTCCLLFLSLILLEKSFSI